MLIRIDLSFCIEWCAEKRCEFEQIYKIQVDKRIVCRRSENSNQIIEEMKTLANALDCQDLRIYQENRIY